jgi:hypothetical protein
MNIDSIKANLQINVLKTEEVKPQTARGVNEVSVKLWWVSIRILNVKLIAIGTNINKKNILLYFNNNIHYGTKYELE